MDNKLESINLRVFGWSTISKHPRHKKLEEDMNNCKTKTFETFKDFSDDELCVYLFLNDSSDAQPYLAYLGWVKYIYREPGASWRSAYKFHPMKKIKIEDLIFCKCCWEPWEVVVQKSELPKTDFE
jgi:hypothetical protein